MIGKLLDYRYKVIRVLATGGFGETYIAEDTKRPGNPICVVKHLKPVSSDSKIFDTAKRLFQSEAETLERLGNHDQIPRLLAYFDDSLEFYLVQEFIEGHTLSEELVSGETWTEAQVIQLLDEILNILEFVHHQGGIHRDIKPDNIIRRRSDNKLVLVDFGAVKQLRAGSYPGVRQIRNAPIQQSATVAIGTPGYMPTEQGQGKPRPNSDIYALGIIAIQALTGIAPMDLQEDQNTGETLWQHLVPVNQQLATVLNKMVRYHFKDRYQNAPEALQALRTFMPARVSSVQEYPKVYSSEKSYAIARIPSPQSRQKTIAVAPGNREPQAAIASAKPVHRGATGPDLLQILILMLLAGGAAYFAPGVVKNVQGFTANWTKGNSLAAQTCMAVTSEKANIRSEPTAISSETILQTASEKTGFEVTGTRTKKGWVQVRLDTGKVAWVHSDVVGNNEEWITCLRDKGIAMRTINDSSVIANRPAPKPKPKSKNPIDFLTFPGNNSENTEQGKTSQVEPIPTTSAQPNGGNSPAENRQVVEKAREKYESGDLQGALDLLKSLPASIEETGKMVSQWQNDWTKAEALFKDIDEAVAQGNWDKVQSYRNNPDKLPNIKYWQDKINPLVQQAANNISNNISKQAENLTKQQQGNQAGKSQVDKSQNIEKKKNPKPENKQDNFFNPDSLFDFGNSEATENPKQEENEQ
ncbi:serine/threonine protein kinase [Brunnivagina elsteri]|uniref:non-specific serine/threonine protein kinase n=1 Tax=Brunnivagina elsteri CCALA 953 TaxID=987040 RepID=A0A2A2TDY9_9CYAN|nr:serine/threonine protein kinase [Calothrix elsteri]PAX51911.1 serine/threonine protein kinase [Calothrix elsteri CCALA 953]